MSDEQPPPLTGDVHAGPLVTQKHGGKIRRGDARPKDPTAADCRNSARKKFYQELPHLKRLAKSAEKEGDQIRAIDTLGKYGLADTVNLSDLRAALSETMKVLDETLSPELALVVKQRIGPVWLRVWAA